MCTVTFVRSANKTIITSNRDEQVLRQAIEPKSYEINGKSLVFPKDPQAGGTWYAVDEHGNVLVLLNGGNEKHKWNPPYRRSRGLILLDIISAESPLVMWKEIDLTDIEPFTLVLFQQGSLYQLRWDATQKDSTELPVAENHIWSTSMLSTRDIREKREKWFANFMRFNAHPTAKDLYHFHHYAESGDTENGLVINRNNFLKTLSITQAVIQEGKVKINYHDLTQRKDFVHSFEIV